MYHDIPLYVPLRPANSRGVLHFLRCMHLSSVSPSCFLHGELITDPTLYCKPPCAVRSSVCESRPIFLSLLLQSLVHSNVSHRLPDSINLPQDPKTPNEAARRLQPGEIATTKTRTCALHLHFRYVIPLCLLGVLKPQFCRFRSV